MIPLATIPLAWRWLALLLLSLALVYVGWSAGADHVQGRWDAVRLEQTRQQLADQAAARAQEQEFNRQLQEAQHAAAEREQALRADLDAYRRAARGLRDTIAALERELPAATPAACRNTAAVALDVFGQCAERLGEMAAAADRHASDVQTLTDAWPR